MSGQHGQNRQQTGDMDRSDVMDTKGTIGAVESNGSTGVVENKGATGAVVVGAGIGGLRAALDLADSGHHVTLIDKSPHMGGLLSKLDHQFPSDGCGMCRMLPTIHRDTASQFCLRRGMAHENITLMCGTTLDHIDGEAGNYTVRLRQRNQLVNPDLCTGCGACVAVCPVEVPDLFNEGMGTQKAIYLPLPHVTPKTYTIDTTHCTQCGECVNACPENAVALPEDRKASFKILVVDDELIVRDSVKEWFEFEGYTVEMADSGPKALEMIKESLSDTNSGGDGSTDTDTRDSGSAGKDDRKRGGKNRYSLMMLDIKMPEMEGTEVLKEAKKIDPDLKVVMMTAYATVRTAVETMKSGALEYIIKPFDPDTLIEKVDRIYQAGVQSDDILSELSAGVLILACGTGYYNPLDGPNTLGYRVFSDVLTGLEYERLLSGSGPTGGKLLRPSTGEAPQRIAWIQCVGSRETRSGAPYCSSICCMFALKEAVLTKKVLGDAVETVIYYMDMRCFGKAFEAYKKEAVEGYGVILKRTRPHTVRMDEKSGRLRIYVADPTVGFEPDGLSGAAEEEEETETKSTESEVSKFKRKIDEVFDLVVLSVGQRPTSETNTLAEMTGIPLNAFGYPETGTISEMTGVGVGKGASDDVPHQKIAEGIFIGGAFTGGKDIAESVIHASAAAARAMSILNGSGGGNGAGRVKPVGVMERQAEVTDPAMGNNGRDGSDPLGLDALTPLIPAEVTVTTRLAAFQEPKNGKDPSIQSIGVNGAVLIIGGGPAGMTAALAIAAGGYKAVMVEKAPDIGGNLRWIGKNIKGDDFTRLLDVLTEKIIKHPMISLHRNAEITASSGEVGDFQSTIVIRSDGMGPTREMVSHGATIIATGASEAKPVTTAFGLGTHKAVTTVKGFQQALMRYENAGSVVPPDASASHPDAGTSPTHTKDIDPLKLETVVMIQCVESRDEIKPYCSRVCCTASLKHALALKRINPHVQIYILYRDMMSYGFAEIYYDEARRNDIIFIQYDNDAPPQVVSGDASSDDEITIRVHEPIVGMDVEISADLLVLATGMTPNCPEEQIGPKERKITDTGKDRNSTDPEKEREDSILPHSTGDLAEILGVERDGYRFYKQGDSKWRPVDSTREGIFLCGTAMGPRDVEESMTSAKAAAMRAMRIISHDVLETSSVTAGVKTSLCSLCMKCVDTCPYEARRFDEEKRIIAVNAAVCQGCGACAAVCPNSASYLTEFSDQQMFERIDTAIGYFA